MAMAPLTQNSQLRQETFMSIGIFLVCQSKNWKKLEVNFNQSDCLEEFQERAIKLNTTKQVFASAKVFYCWTVPQDYGNFNDVPINLVFICAESLSTCCHIHASLKREAAYCPSNQITRLVPADIEIDGAVFWFESNRMSAKDRSRAQESLGKHFKAYSPKRDSAFLGVLSSDMRNNSKSEKESNNNDVFLQFENLQTLYMTLNELVYKILVFRIGTKLTQFSSQLLPTGAISTDYDALNQYETLEISYTDDSDVKFSQSQPAGVFGFGSLGELEPARKKLHSLSLSTQSAQTYFDTKSSNSKASQTNIYDEEAEDAKTPSQMNSSSNEVFWNSPFVSNPSASPSLRVPTTKTRNFSAHSLRLQPSADTQNCPELPPRIPKPQHSKRKSSTTNRFLDEPAPERRFGCDTNPADLSKSNLSLQLFRPRETTEESKGKTKSAFQIFTGSQGNDLDDEDVITPTPVLESSKHPTEILRQNQSLTAREQNRRSSTPRLLSSNKNLTDFEKKHLQPWRPNGFHGNQKNCNGKLDIREDTLDFCQSLPSNMSMSFFHNVHNEPVKVDASPGKLERQGGDLQNTKRQAPVPPRVQNPTQDRTSSHTRETSTNAQGHSTVLSKSISSPFGDSKMNFKPLANGKPEALNDTREDILAHRRDSKKSDNSIDLESSITPRKLTRKASAKLAAILPLSKIKRRKQGIAHDYRPPQLSDSDDLQKREVDSSRNDNQVTVEINNSAVHQIIDPVGIEHSRNDPSNLQNKPVDYTSRPSLDLNLERRIFDTKSRNRKQSILLFPPKDNHDSEGETPSIILTAIDNEKDEKADKFENLEQTECAPRRKVSLQVERKSRSRSGSCSSNGSSTSGKTDSSVSSTVSSTKYGLARKKNKSAYAASHSATGLDPSFSDQMNSAFLGPKKGKRSDEKKRKTSEASSRPGNRQRKEKRD